MVQRQGRERRSIMSKLGDFLKNKKTGEKSVQTQTKVEETKTDVVKLYNKIWLNKVSNQMGYIISSDERKVNGILEALNRKNGHCPCGGNGTQFLCPCVNMREYGICKCGLYENVRQVSPTGSSEARIK